MSNMNAALIAHWPGQDTPVCEKHLRGLKNVWGIIGVGELSTTPCLPTTCSNCENESKEEPQ